MAINRELPGDMAGTVTDLDISMVERYLKRSRENDDRVTVDARHLEQLCNEVWRRRRAEREAREAGVSAEAERSNRLALMATKAVADVGHSRLLEGRPREATAIVQVANMLAELMDFRERLTSVQVEGFALSGSKAAAARVSELMAELVEWRSGERSNPRTDHIARSLGDGLIVHGSAEAMERLRKMQEELESARRIIQELERMGWLMKAAAKP